MIDSSIPPVSLSNEELIASTFDLVRRSCGVEADLLVHLGEIDERRLYLDRAIPSMLAFCVGELGFSEDAACNRIAVARAARRLPAIIETVRTRQVHLTGLRLLLPHLTEANHGCVLAEAAGRSRREIEELVAELAPRPAVPSMIRRLPDRAVAFPTAAEPATPRRSGFPVPARLRFPVPARLRFPVPVRLARGANEARNGRAATSRHVPAAMQRAVHERDGGRCTFVSDDGRRCAATGALEIDHVEGFARTWVHAIDGLRLLCRTHNQHAAERMYGRGLMERARARPVDAGEIHSARSARSARSAVNAFPGR